MMKSYKYHPSAEERSELERALGKFVAVRAQIDAERIRVQVFEAIAFLIDGESYWRAERGDVTVDGGEDFPKKYLFHAKNAFITTLRPLVETHLGELTYASSV